MSEAETTGTPIRLAPDQSRPLGQSPGAADRPPPNARPIKATVAVNATALLTAEEGGGYSVAIPALPGCISCGNTLEDALANIREAAEGWLLTQHDIETGAIKFEPAGAAK